MDCKQNPMDSGEPSESQVGLGGQPDMLYKSSISHSGCGIRYHKSTSSVVIKKSNQMNYKKNKIIIRKILNMREVTIRSS